MVRSLALLLILGAAAPAGANVAAVRFQGGSTIKLAAVPHLPAASIPGFLAVARPLVELGPIAVIPTPTGVAIVSEVAPHAGWVRTDGSGEATTAFLKDQGTAFESRRQAAAKSGDYTELYSFLASAFDETTQPNNTSFVASPSAATTLDAAIIAADRNVWRSTRGNKKLTLFVQLDGKTIDSAVAASLRRGAKLERLFRQGSRAHKAAVETLIPVLGAADNAGVKRDYHYSFNGSGSNIFVELTGTKTAITRSLANTKVLKSWLARPGGALDGNRLYMASPIAHGKYVSGESTVYIRRGKSPWLKVGPAEIKPTYADAPATLPIEIESLEELPYSRVGRDALNGLSPGLKWEDMLEDMKSYYKPKPNDPGFLPTDIVTVVRLRRR
ncbi:MAG: hypothetical protein HYZ75_04410 [Elusimicrobia bacterium]|nr:hypothetical protein [Elusimicrobiota bacterium]